MNRPIRVGGSFAPPINDTLKAKYDQLAEACQDDQCRTAMRRLLAAVRKFEETPRSRLPAVAHSVAGEQTPLEDVEVKRIREAVPFPAECDLMGQAFAQLRGETRDAAYHLLWFARELNNGREPLTTDRV